MLKAMVVSISPIERRSVRRMIQNADNGIDEVLEADTTEKAAAMLRKDRIDMLLCDMPGSIIFLLYLVDVVREKNPEAAVIFMTSRNEKDAAIETAKVRNAVYILKPFYPADLLRRIDMCLSGVYISERPPMEEEKAEILNRVREGLMGHSYRTAMKASKEYINMIYGRADSYDYIRDQMIAFFHKLEEYARGFDLEMHDSIINEIRRKRVFEDLHKNRYNSYLIAEMHIKYIFIETDKTYEYNNGVERALNFIDQNIKGNVTLEQAASAAQVNAYYFSKLFKKQMNVKFITYLTEEKIELAKEMLMYTNMSILNIACDLSYVETGYFSKIFKKHTGMTPSEFRQKYKVKPMISDNKLRKPRKSYPLYMKNRLLII